MAKIKITDLPQNMKISKEELRRVRGGACGSYLTIRDKYDQLARTTTSPLADRMFKI